MRLCDLGDLVVIGGDDDALEDSARDGGFDGPGDHRLTAEVADVLARDALAAAADGDDAEVHWRLVVCRKQNSTSPQISSTTKSTFSFCLPLDIAAVD